MMRSIRRAVRPPIRVLALALLVLTALAPFSAAAQGSTTDVRLYFLIDGKIATTTRAVKADNMPATAAMDALFDGPAIDEYGIGLRTQLPSALALAKPLKLDATTKTVTISLPSIFKSDSAATEAERTAQIVYTLTQFPTITAVNFAIDGKPYQPLTGEGKRASGAVGRTDYEALVPAILIESVSAANPLHVEGTSNTFEGQFDYALYDAGNKKIASGYTTATSGSGTRGTFAFDVPYQVSKSQTGTLVAFEKSAKDGSTINLVARPVMLQPNCC
jgi:hypothetical protein